MIFKGLQIPTLDELMNSRNILDLKDSWHFMLEAQMKTVPSADEYLNQLDDILLGCIEINCVKKVKWSYSLFV